MKTVNLKLSKKQAVDVMEGAAHLLSTIVDATYSTDLIRGETTLVGVVPGATLMDGCSISVGERGFLTIAGPDPETLVDLFGDVIPNLEKELEEGYED